MLPKASLWNVPATPVASATLAMTRLDPTSETYSVSPTRARPNGLSKSTLVPAAPAEKVPNCEYVGGPPPPARIESCSEPGATR